MSRIAFITLAVSITSLHYLSASTTSLNSCSCTMCEDTLRDEFEPDQIQCSSSETPGITCACYFELVDLRWCVENTQSSDDSSSYTLTFNRLLQNQKTEGYTSSCKQCILDPKNNSSCVVAIVFSSQMKITTAELVLASFAVSIEIFHFYSAVYLPLQERFEVLKTDSELVKKDSAFVCPYRSNARRMLGLKLPESTNSYIYSHFVLAILCTFANIGCSIGKLFPARYNCTTHQCSKLMQNAVLNLATCAIELFERRALYVIVIPESPFRYFPSSTLRFAFRAAAIALSVAWTALDFVLLASSAPGPLCFGLGVASCALQSILVAIDGMILHKQVPQRLHKQVHKQAAAQAGILPACAPCASSTSRFRAAAPRDVQRSATIRCGCAGRAGPGPANIRPPAHCEWTASGLGLRPPGGRARHGGGAASAR